MIAGAGVHGEQLVADPEGGLSPCLDLVGLGKSEAELA
jgi:hypothetical protein